MIHYDIYTYHKILNYIFTQRNLNVRQDRWLELVKDYDCDIHYHPGKANKVANALSWKNTRTLMSLRALPLELAKEIRNMGLEIIVASLSALIIQPILYDRIKEG